MRTLLQRILDSFLVPDWTHEEDAARREHHRKTTEAQRNKEFDALDAEATEFCNQTKDRQPTPAEWAWYESIRRREAML
jgi:hypothetical protein